MSNKKFNVVKTTSLGTVIKVDSQFTELETNIITNQVEPEEYDICWDTARAIFYMGSGTHDTEKGKETYTVEKTSDLPILDEVSQLVHTSSVLTELAKLGYKKVAVTNQSTALMMGLKAAEASGWKIQGTDDVCRGLEYNFSTHKYIKNMVACVVVSKEEK